MDDQLTPSSIYELVAEEDFKKHFHLGGFNATKELIDLCPIGENSYVLDEDGTCLIANQRSPLLTARAKPQYQSRR